MFEQCVRIGHTPGRSIGIVSRKSWAALRENEYWICEVCGVIYEEKPRKEEELSDKALSSNDAEEDVMVLHRSESDELPRSCPGVFTGNG